MRARSLAPHLPVAEASVRESSSISLFQVTDAMFALPRFALLRLVQPLRPDCSRWPLTLCGLLAIFGLEMGGLEVSGLANVVAPRPAFAQEPSAEKVDFVKQIKPIFEQHCLACHGPEKEEDFRIDNREAAMDYIIPGKAKESQMYTVLLSEDPEELMPPPDEKNPLKPEQIKLIERWIDEGATWPEGVEFKLPEKKQGGAGSQPAGGTEPAALPTQQPQSGAAPLLDEPTTNNTTGPKPVTAPQESTQESTVGKTSGEAAQTKPAESSPPQGAADKGEESKPEKKAYSIFNAIGSLHPAILHMPIGLLVAAGLFGLIGIRGNFVMSDCAYYCLWLGTFGAVLACVSGWWFSPMEGRGTVTAVQDLWNQQQPIFWHRTAALVVTFLSVCLCLYARSARLRDPDDGILWKLGAMLLALGIGLVGHNGGELTHGKNLYRDLTGLVEESTGWDLDGK